MERECEGWFSFLSIALFCENFVLSCIEKYKSVAMYIVEMTFCVFSDHVTKMIERSCVNDMKLLL